jgi:integrase
VKKSFAAACKLAGVEGFRFHDCRHTAITRMVQMNISPTIVMKISGHTQHNTFARYVNPDTGAALQAADTLSTFNEASGTQTGTEAVN